MKMHHRGSLGIALSLWLGLSGCSSDDSNGSSGAGGSQSTGGASTGGAPGSAGASNAGTSNGGQGTGGASNGGASNGGARTGGASGTGTGGASTGGTGAGGMGGGTSPGGASGATGTDGGTDTDAAGGPFTLTSTAYTNGMTIPAENTCAGANTSPPLTWTAGPAGTKSYTLVLTDKTNMLVHWTLWDIPVAPRSLPAALPAGMPTGSHGASIGNNGGAYSGPCPSGNLHTYQFDLYAVDVATLPIAANSNQTAVVSSVMMHKLAVASLSGTSNARRP